MKRVVFPCLGLVALLFGSGCTMLHRNPKAVREIAADTDSTFRDLWTQKRAAELVAQGISADAAAAQSREEFDSRYGYAQPAP